MTTDTERQPTIADAKAIAQQYGKDGVIVFHVSGGKVGYASYGQDRPRCQRMRRIADQVIERICDGRISCR